MFPRFRLLSGAMRKQARLSIELCGILTGLLLLGFPTGSVQAQDDEEEEAQEEGGDIDSMMQTDPDRPAAEEGEGEGDGDDEQAGDEERPAGESEGDDERPPGEPEDESTEEDQPEAPVAPTGTEGFEVAILGGYGISFEDGPNLWSGAFGLRLGYDLGPVVLGGRFVYYTGGTAEITTAGRFGGPVTEEVSANIWELSVEVAYDAELSPTVALRPGLGFGFASANRDGAQSKLYGAVSPGIALLISPAPSFFLGLDARFQIVTASPEAAKGLILLATIGMRF